MTGRNAQLVFYFDDQALSAQPGQSVAAALMAAGIWSLRQASDGTPRGVFCGMGTCFECAMTIDGTPEQRACITLVRPGMRVQPGGRRLP